MTSPTAGGRLGSAFIRITADVSRFAAGAARGIQTGITQAVNRLNLRPLHSAATTAGATAGQLLGAGLIRHADGRLRDLRGRFVREGVLSGQGFSRGFARAFHIPNVHLGGLFTGVAAKVTAITVALVKLLPLMADLGVIAAGLAGSIPLAITALVTVFLSLKLAVKGVGDALSAVFEQDPKKLEEALKKLAPAARQFVLQIKAISPELRAVQQGVQQSFFAPLNEGLRQLIRSPALAIVRNELQVIADYAGHTGRNLLIVFANAAKSGLLAEAMRPIRDLFGALVSLIPTAAVAFLNLTKAAAPFVTMIVGSMREGLIRFFAMINQAAADGSLAGMFKNAGEQLRQLGGVFKDIFSIISSVFSALTHSSDSALGAIGAITHQLALFLKTAEGQEVLLTLGEVLHGIGDIITTILKPLLPIAAQLIGILGAGLATAFERIIPPLGILLDKMSDALMPLIVALTPVVDELSVVLTDFLVQALTEVAKHIGSMTPVMRDLAAELGPQLIPVVKAFGEALIALIPLIPVISRLIVDLVPVLLDLVPVFLTMTQISAALWKAIAWGITNIVVPVVQLFANWVRIAFGAAAAVISFWWDAVKIRLESFWAVISNVIIPVINVWKTAAEFVFNYVKFVIAGWWAAAQIVFQFFKIAIEGLVIKPVRIMWEVLQPIWNKFSALIEGVWNLKIKPVLTNMGKFITEDVPKAFRVGVDAVIFAWNRLREGAQKPVEFVIDTVINKGIIGTFNKIAKAFGVGGIGEVPNPFRGGGGGGGGGTARFTADGGLLTGPGGPRDDQIPVMASNGEFVINAASTRRFLPLIRWINDRASRGGGPREGEFADGGLIGNLASLFLNPGKILTDTVGKLLGQVPGGGNIRDLAVGMGGKVLNLAVDKVKSLFSGLLGGPGQGGGIGSGAMMGILRGVFPGLPLISGYRPGSTTVSGGVSYHARNRAVDIPPIMSIARWIAANYGRATKELIFSPMGHDQIKNGARHLFSGPVVAQHFDHIHWAMKRGGLVGKIPSFGQGGFVDKPTLGVVGDVPEFIIPAPGGRPGITVQVFIGGRELTEIVDTRVSVGLTGAGRELALGARG